MTKPSKTIAILVPALLLAAFAAAPAGASAAAPSGIVAAWTQVVPDSIAKSHLQARAVIPNGIPCPKVKKLYSDGRVSQGTMTMRSPGATTGPAFASLRACQANLPTGLKSASVGAIYVPARLHSKIDEIAVFGDTGCRITSSMVQNCASPAEWPLAENARAVAKADPDVIFFTGDFFYREAACPAGKLALCGGSPPPALLPAAGQKFAPISDTDYGWVADTLIPMAPAFSAAPILVTRGNHESCFRGGNGWMMMFEIQLKPDSCAPTAEGTSAPNNAAPTYAVDFPITDSRTLRAVMVDSNAGDNEEITPAWQPTQRATYEQGHSLAAPKKGREAWLVTHRPMFGIDDANDFDPGELNWTSVDQTQAARGLIGRYELMLASHIHTAQVVQMPAEPAQIVFGNGGSMPNPGGVYPVPKYGPLNNDQGQPIANATDPYQTVPSYFWNAVKYGHAIVTPGKKAGQWTFSQRDVTGKQFAVCSATGKNVTCK